MAAQAAVDKLTDTTQRQGQSKPRLELVGHDGNAFAILGRAKQAAQKAGWTSEQITALFDEATAGDHIHLIATMERHFDTSY